jgi:hypothetical protein
MKSLALIFISFLLLQVTSLAQQGWFEQTSGTTEALLSVTFVDNLTGWVVGGRGTILKTTDGGANWNAQTSGTTEWLFSVHFIDNNIGWAVGYNGKILKTTNGGTNWNSQTSGTTAELESVYFTDNNTGWAVGWDGTILHTTNGGVSFIEEKEIDEIPTDYNLSHNYPNPFNPNTKIRYSIPQLSNVVIKVFDILGNEIETLVNEEKQAGTYELTWYANEIETLVNEEKQAGTYELTWYAENLPSGNYFYQLRTGSFVETKNLPALPTGRQAAGRDDVVEVVYILNLLTD